MRVFATELVLQVPGQDIKPLNLRFNWLLELYSVSRAMRVLLCSDLAISLHCLRFYSNEEWGISDIDSSLTEYSKSIGLEFHLNYPDNGFGRWNLVIGTNSRNPRLILQPLLPLYSQHLYPASELISIIVQITHSEIAQFAWYLSCAYDRTNIVKWVSPLFSDF